MTLLWQSCELDYECNTKNYFNKNNTKISCQKLHSKITPQFMEPKGSMSHSQGLSYNPYPELNKPISLRYTLKLSSHLCLGLPKGLSPVGLLANILKTLLPSSILATCPSHPNLLDLIILVLLSEQYKL